MRWIPLRFQLKLVSITIGFFRMKLAGKTFEIITKKQQETSRKQSFETADVRTNPSLSTYFIKAKDAFLLI